MDLIDDYLNQTLILKKKTGTNKYKECTYSNQSIKGRFEYKRKLVLNALGDKIVSEARIFSKILLNTDDMIEYDNRKWKVIITEHCVGLEGKISHYQTYLV